jgi:hypothetical protein
MEETGEGHERVGTREGKQRDVTREGKQRAGGKEERTVRTREGM